MKSNSYSENMNVSGTFWDLNLKWIINLVLIFVSTLGSDIALAKTIVIDDKDNSCQPVNTDYANCAAACEADAKGCAMDILTFINSDVFMTSRLQYPDSPLDNPNPSTPMHGLFNSMYVNDIADKAIQSALKNPFDPINLPAWSIVAKYNKNPSADESKDVDVWETHMYKIPGYCPNRAVAADDGVCIGGEWFWFLYRGGLLSFDYDPQYGGEQAWGKAEAFCIDCHGAVTNTDWLWRLNYLLKPIQQSQKPLRFDNETPPDHETSINTPKTSKNAFRFAEFCDNVTGLKSSIPYDVRFDPTKLTAEQAQRMFNCYSWEAFIGLNWPALPEQRGVADADKAITAEGNRVWETFAQVYEAFQPQNPEWTLDDKQWNNSQKLPQVCQDAIASTPDTIDQNARTFQVLNESHQAYGNQFNNLVDQNSKELRYNVRLNETEWDFVKQNGYADTGNYDYHGPLSGSIVFPDNRAGNKNGQGSIEIKSAWKELCTKVACNPLDNPEEYYWRYVLIYNAAVAKSQGTQPETCRVARMGLVGLHAIFKTFWQPQWIWSTFEHVKNVPDVGQSVDPNISPNPYSLFNPQCLLEGMQPTPEQCLLGERPGIFGNSDPTLCCQNLQLILNSHPDPNNPQAQSKSILPEEEAIPNHITRLNKVGTDAETLNQVFRPLLKKQGSVWQNYKLINTQWALDGRLSGDSSFPYAVVDLLCLNGTKPPCFTLIPQGERLRNTTMETFQASYCKPDDENIGNDPENCKLSTIANNPVQVSSAGCMNCHLDAGNDASFLWADGVEEQVHLGPCTGSLCPVIPGSPDVSILINGLNVALNWDTVIGASGYKLHYAPYPYTGPESIGSLDLGNKNNFSAELWEGAAFFVAISAYNSVGESGYSNIEQFNLK